MPFFRGQKSKFAWGGGRLGLVPDPPLNSNFESAPEDNIIPLGLHEETLCPFTSNCCEVAEIIHWLDQRTEQYDSNLAPQK